MIYSEEEYPQGSDEWLELRAGKVTASKITDIMAKLNEEENITFIFSTHDQKVINRAKRVVTLEDGKIVSDEMK